MPEAPAHRVPSMTRRQSLAGLALLGPAGLLAACTASGDPSQDPSASASPTGSTGAALSQQVAAAEEELIAMYESVIGAFPALGAALGDIRDQHRAHAVALAGGDAAPSSPPSAGPAVPADRQGALSMLIAAERDAMRNRISDCVAAPDIDLARTLAFIAASEGSHVPALRKVRP